MRAGIGIPVALSEGSLGCSYPSTGHVPERRANHRGVSCSGGRSPQEWEITTAYGVHFFFLPRRRKQSEAAVRLRARTCCCRAGFRPPCYCKSGGYPTTDYDSARHRTRSDPIAVTVIPGAAFTIFSVEKSCADHAPTAPMSDTVPAAGRRLWRDLRQAAGCAG
jgi:hypothetical protein